MELTGLNIDFMSLKHRPNYSRTPVLTALGTLGNSRVNDSSQVFHSFGEAPGLVGIDRLREGFLFWC